LNQLHGISINVLTYKRYLPSIGAYIEKLQSPIAQNYHLARDERCCYEASHIPRLGWHWEKTAGFSGTSSISLARVVTQAFPIHDALYFITFYIDFVLKNGVLDMFIEAFRNC
jgi:hypothetical protein